MHNTREVAPRLEQTYCYKIQNSYETKYFVKRNMLWDLYNISTKIPF